ncbi:unnamed protein product [Rotaria sp. Silwood2]|nr:unnamed protein product [Rotaria sp. Silwood2]CAF4369435.1 unnamed protein product [Rotaria sp. Silwood2]
MKYSLGTASCIQPVDSNNSVIFNNDRDILAVAPAEKNKLSSLLIEKNIETLAFSHLFPDGKGSCDEERITKLNGKEYCKARLFSADLCFASDASYIFYLQYLGNLKQAFSGSNIALRKMLPLTASQSNDENQLKFLFKNDIIYRYLQSVHGSPQFWYERLKDLFSGAFCLGNVKDWFARVEMQLRGSSHVHVPLWVDKAPKYKGKNMDEKTISEIIEFCDKYITTKFPSREEDAELHDIIKDVQTHSRNHSKSRLKFHKTTCRFDFPSAISRRTLISLPYLVENEAKVERVKIAKKTLRDMNIELNELEKEKILNWTNFDSLLAKHG